MIKDLIKLANNLDAKGLKAEADCLDSIIIKIAEDDGRVQEQRIVKELGYLSDFLMERVRANSINRRPNEEAIALAQAKIDLIVNKEFQESFKILFNDALKELNQSVPEYSKEELLEMLLNEERQIENVHIYTDLYPSDFQIEECNKAKIERLKELLEKPMFVKIKEEIQEKIDILNNSSNAADFVTEDTIDFDGDRDIDNTDAHLYRRDQAIKNNTK